MFLSSSLCVKAHWAFHFSKSFTITKSFYVLIALRRFVAFMCIMYYVSYECIMYDMSVMYTMTVMYSLSALCS